MTEERKKEILKDIGERMLDYLVRLHKLREKVKETEKEIAKLTEEYDYLNTMEPSGIGGTYFKKPNIRRGLL